MSIQKEIVIIGAGISGILTAIQLQKNGWNDYLILEKNADLGGTWFSNTYPGARCDIPSILYSYSFEPNSEWKETYSDQQEILAYVKKCADKYKILLHIQFKTEVIEANFDEKISQWVVKTKDNTFLSKFLIIATGQLSKPYTPHFPGIERFKGVTFHSAGWNHAYDLKNKRVAVIGNAASAIQFIPQIASQVKELLIFQRTPNWIVPSRNKLYTDKQRTVYRTFPFIQKIVRALSWIRREIGWPSFLLHSKVGQKMRTGYTQKLAFDLLNRQIPDKTIQKSLIPNYPSGSKRILLSSDYYPTLLQKHVKIICDPIQGFSEKLIKAKDSYEIDAVIFATGFKSSEFVFPIKVTGRDGLNLETAWHEGAEAYLGMTIPKFPNLFILYGPNSNIGHNSVIFMVECQLHYILQCLNKTRKFQTIEVKEEVMQKWNEEMEKRLKETVWASDVNNWYKNKQGRIVNNWPYSTFYYWWRTVKFHPKEYTLK